MSGPGGSCGVKNRGHSPLTHNALAYTWQQLARRAGVIDEDSPDTGFEGLGVTVHYTRPDQIQLDRPGIIVVPCRDAAWPALLERVPHSLDWLPAGETVPAGADCAVTGPIPVLFWGAAYEDGQRPFAEQKADGTVIFYVDIVASTFFMLSRWEEMMVRVRDKHDRFPAAASVAYKQGFLDRPIVDVYGLILQAWLKKLLPAWQPKPGRFSVKLTHDVDSIRRLRNLYSAALVFGADLLKRHDPVLAWQTINEAIRQFSSSPEQAAYFRAIYFLAELSKQFGQESAFYFMAAEPQPPDNDYEVHSALMRKCIDDLRQQGCELGFHPGYHTLNNPERLALEKARLDAVLGETRYGGRQHYLRFQVPDTWRHWEQVGLTYDSTMAYADHEGFRCGTCHRFRPFDVGQDRKLYLWERPLIVMDSTLRQYRQLTPAQGEQRILELARQCQQVQGTFILLWHNSSLTERWQLWATMYQRIIANEWLNC
jgi:hypothetical protein